MHWGFLSFKSYKVYYNKKVNCQPPGNGTGTGDGLKLMGMDWKGKVTPVPGHDSKISSLNSINMVVSKDTHFYILMFLQFAIFK